MQPIEKLGAFYLGKEFDLRQGQLLEDLVMYDARDLTTHAVCVGMTGSGKTGLCIDLLEEAAIDSVPALIIDPKGDITNLLLTFPDLRPEDFQPWINADDARRKDMSVADFAAKTAGDWREGLAAWGEGPERIQMLKESAEFRIYTPGSDAGLTVSIMASLLAPDLSWDEYQEELREQILGTVSALLGLVGINADPLRSREHILLANIFEHFWRQGLDLDLAQLITAVQNPPIHQLGVFDVDTFFPEKDRFGLAMAFNSIIASPSFAAWIQGEPLDIAGLLHSPSGKPRHSIFYIAHLSDAERMFFVTLLLEQLITWMRQQSGTTSLRALLYMDEVFGFFPPVQNPPSKRPLLTLMKQARAFGLGVVLTTQNPVDLDYKGLTNAGTWFIGKLQTERDKERVLEGLESATAEAGGGLDRSGLDKAISALGSRVFLLHNVHEDGPVIFQTRWAMSYLRGPLTRDQVRKLMAETKAQESALPQPTVAAAAVPSSPSQPAPDPTAAVPDGYSHTPPALPPDVTQTYLPLRSSPNRAAAVIEQELGQQIQPEETRLVYEPGLLAMAKVSFVDRTRDVNETTDVKLLIPPGDLSAVIRWGEADVIDIEPRELEKRPEKNALFATAPAGLNTASEVRSYEKDFSDWLYHESRLPIFHNPTLNLYGQPGEAERDFQARAQLAAREARDEEVAALRKKYQTQIDRVRTRLEREQRELVEDQAEYDSRKQEEWLTHAETALGVLGIFGRRRSLSSSMTKRRMTGRAQADIKESEQEIARLQDEIEDIQKQLENDATDVTQNWADALDQIQTYEVKPRRVDVQVELVALAWVPHWEIGYRSAAGRSTFDRIPAWK